MGHLEWAWCEGVAVMVDFEPAQLEAWLAQSPAGVNSVREMPATKLPLYIYSRSQSLLLNLAVAVERCGRCLLRLASHACVAQK